MRAQKDWPQMLLAAPPAFLVAMRLINWGMLMLVGQALMQDARKQLKHR